MLIEDVPGADSSKEEEDAYWEKVDEERSEVEEEAEEELFDFFVDFWGFLQPAVWGLGDPEDEALWFDVLEIINLVAFTGNLMNLLTKQTVESYASGYTFFAQADPQALAMSTQMQQTISNLLSKASSIPQTTVNRLQKALTDLLATGDATFQDVRNTFEQTLKAHGSETAKTTAQTTVRAAWNAGMLESAYNLGMEVKGWLSQRDGKVRDTHIIADGQTQSILLPFQVGNSLMQYPGDPAGEPEEVINCRCVLFFA